VFSGRSGLLIAAHVDCKSLRRALDASMLERDLSEKIAGSAPMWPAFNIIMRVVSTLIGVAMILMGTVWILQGLNLAFRVGFMVGNYHWTIYGTILALLGIAEIVWSNTRQKIP
jgi:hypothetical protein